MSIGMWGTHNGKGTFGVLAYDTRDSAWGEVLKSIGGLGLKGRMCNKGLDTESFVCLREGRGFFVT
jgi:hypothetical protein